MPDESENIGVAIQVLQSQVSDIRRRSDAQDTSIKVLDKCNTVNTVNITNLEIRQSKHSAEHANNYEKLDKKIDESTGKIFELIGKMSKQINLNSGRDAVLKVLFGTFAGGIIMWVVKTWFSNVPIQ